ACGQGRSDQQRNFDTAAVEARDIEVTASATGVVQPIRVVEVKSKASGEIIELPVDTGDWVEQGAVLAKLYPRDAENQFAQARADVIAARARRDTAKSEFDRATQLFERGLLPKSDFETKRLEVANAEAQLVRANTQLEIFGERLKETVVIAAVSGRIIEKNVELGNVVSSAVSQVGGGTTLMKMADLRRVQIRALVDETDIGRIHPGQDATIRVDALPGRSFDGTIAKIEPQAIVDQNVTMFPVLIEIDNADEVLRPGMNAEVDVFVSRHPNVLTVPNEALKSTRDAATAAGAVGLTPEEVRAALEGAGGAEGGRGREGAKAAGAPERASRTGAAPEGRRRGMSGRPGTGAGTGTGARGFGAGRPGRERTQTAVVFKYVQGKAVPTIVTTGVSNWEHTQIVSGLAAGDTVIVLPSSSLLRQQEEFRDRMRNMSGQPGVGGGGGGGRR
ncbi:MAG TPA: efflux RND transporter periplasmic adaptor subunit, partial [Thermoanaerobaculia bacterium]|nr:efflux RND transporter periplasmic adaptor subunit [Thermoanaerobaculia bacterium]